MTRRADRALALRPRGAWSMDGRGQAHLAHLAHLALGETARGRAELAAARTQQAAMDADIGRAGLSPRAPAAAP